MKLSLWQPIKGKDFSFQDNITRESFYIGSVGIYIHRYEGVLDQGEHNDPSSPSEANSDDWGITTIQDMTLLENKNRKYSDDVFEMRGHFNEADKDFDLLQFNMAITNGTKYITFHLNDMLDKIGRKLMSGDVLEMPNLRDDALLDEGSPAVNQWYVVSDASWPSEGFSSTWFPHLWRVKAEPMVDAPEYYDITKDDEGFVDPLIDLLRTANKVEEINDAVIAKAEVDVPARNFETAHFYVVDGDESGSQYPWIWAGDGIPPNGSSKADSGTSYPLVPTDGDYFLRTDYEPARMFQYQTNTWRFIEIDYRTTWEKADRILESFINNDNTFTEKGETIQEKQSISSVVKPKVDL